MTRALQVAGIVALVSLPFWLDSNYYVNIASQILIWAIFALALNVLVGWAGLVSLGHAGLFGVASYVAAWLLAAGWGQLGAAALALLATLSVTAIFGLLSLRTAGIGFIMITLAIGQVLWGIAYRWIALTNGDNGIIVDTRPAPLAFELDGPGAFYLFVLVAFALTYAAMRVFADSPFGTSLRGTRDQPRRMTALGYDVWAIRFLAILVSGFFSGLAGLLFVYYHQFVSPHALSLASSAEVLLMVISGGTGTLLGPVVGAALVVIVKNVASAYVERWNFVLGAIFVAIVVLMPEGIVPGTARLWRWLRRGRTMARARPGNES
jgi:branched-chain amino acid transport system permease protein